MMMDDGGGGGDDVNPYRKVRFRPHTFRLSI